MANSLSTFTYIILIIFRIMKNINYYFIPSFLSFLFCHMIDPMNKFLEWPIIDPSLMKYIESRWETAYESYRIKFLCVHKCMLHAKSSLILDSIIHTHVAKNLWLMIRLASLWPWGPRKNVRCETPWATLIPNEQEIYKELTRIIKCQNNNN